MSRSSTELHRPAGKGFYRPDPAPSNPLPSSFIAAPVLAVLFVLLLCAPPARAQPGPGDGDTTIEVTAEARAASDSLADAIAEQVRRWLREDGLLTPIEPDSGATAGDPDYRLELTLRGWRLDEDGDTAVRFNRDDLISLRSDVARVRIDWALSRAGEELDRGVARGEESHRGDPESYDHPVELVRADLADPDFLGSRLGIATERAAARVMIGMYRAFPPPGVRIEKLLPDGRLVLSRPDRLPTVEPGDRLEVTVKSPVELSTGASVAVELGPAAELEVDRVQEEYFIVRTTRHDKRYFPERKLLEGKRAEFSDNPLVERYREKL